MPSTKARKNKKVAAPLMLTGSNPNTNLQDVQTVVTNTSGNTLVIGWLPPHGKTLENGESVTIPGDLVSQMKTGGRTNKRKYAAYLRALTNKYVQIYVNHRDIVHAAVDNSTVIAVGDLVWLDTDDVKPAASFAWNSDLATTQADFVNSFMGVALDAHASGGGATTIRVDTSPQSIYKRTCTSATHELGATLGPAKHSSTNTLLNNQLVSAVAASSCARVVERQASASTSCAVRFQSAYYGNNVAGAQ